MAGQSNGPKSDERDTAGRFVKGGPGGPGRPPGSPNRRTLAGRELLQALEAGDPDAKLPSAFARMSKLLKNKDPRVRLGAERLVLSLLHGRPVADPVDPDTGHDLTRTDPAAVAIRLANFVAGALGNGFGANESPSSPETDQDDPSAVA
ncbi:MAG: hypothetical protein KJ062_08390 [Thermoanaerobaculia bacterium]|nr:hypothetical protein [Thermoanaerobaculia bacterium]